MTVSTKRKFPQLYKINWNGTIVNIVKELDGYAVSECKNAFNWYDITPFNPVKIQSKKASLVEAIVNNILGFGSSLLLQLYMFPLFGIFINMETNCWLIFCFSILSIIRSYFVRRLWNCEFWKNYGN